MRLLSFLVLMLLPFYANAFELQFDAEVGPLLREQVLGDFRSIELISSERASSLHEEIFGAVSGSNYLRWFSERVSYFGLSDCGSPASAVACVDPHAKRKIWVTKNYTEINHPQIARIMTLFHEARHTEDENRNWPHALCSIFYGEKSIWTGQSLRLHSACDHTPYGSYASAAVMLHNISKFCTDCSSKVRQDADLYSLDQARRVTRRKAKLRIRGDFQE
jgi:hypothetical protein